MGGKRIELSGQKFGKLTVVDFYENKCGIMYWNCVCECGNKITASTNCLRMGKVKSCGCLKNRPRYTDLTGKKFSMLTVIRLDHVKRYRNTNIYYWLCSCECGNKTVVRSSSLRHNKTKSCGCLSIKQTAKNNKKRKSFNKYDISGEYGIGYTSNNREFYFDLEDFDKIKDYKWHISSNGYVLSSYLPTGSKKGGKTQVMFHRIVMNLPKNELVVDHIDHVKHDNRKSNLRIATYSQNLRNKKPKNGQNVGLYFYKNTQKWGAYINVDYQKINLGYYDSIEDARSARKSAELIYFGEYRYQPEQFDSTLKNLEK
jgi:hypothetical protein